MDLFSVCVNCLDLFELVSKSQLFKYNDGQEEFSPVDFKYDILPHQNIIAI